MGNSKWDEPLHAVDIGGHKTYARELGYVEFQDIVSKNCESQNALLSALVVASYQKEDGSSEFTLDVVRRMKGPRFFAAVKGALAAQGLSEDDLQAVETEVEDESGNATPLMMSGAS